MINSIIFNYIYFGLTGVLALFVTLFAYCLTFNSKAVKTIGSIITAITLLMTLVFLVQFYIGGIVVISILFILIIVNYNNKRWILY